MTSHKKVFDRRGSVPATSLSEELTYRKEVVSPLGEDLHTMKARIGSLELQLDHIRTRLNSGSQKDDDISAATKDQLAESQRAVSIIKQQLNDAVVRLRQRELLLKQREAELEATRQNVDNLSSLREADQRELASLKDVVKNLKGQLTDREVKIKALEHKLTQTRHELDTTKQHLKRTDKELKKTQEDLRTTGKDLRGTKDDLKTTQEELKNTKHDLNNTKDKMSAMENTVKNLVEDMRGIKYRQCEDDLLERQQRDQHHHQQQRHHGHHHHQTATTPPQSTSSQAHGTNQSLSLPPIFNFPPRD